VRVGFIAAQKALRGLDLQASELSDEYLHPKADHCAPSGGALCVTPGATLPMGVSRLDEACPHIRHVMCQCGRLNPRRSTKR
jgi:hypothetical protein